MRIQKIFLRSQPRCHETRICIYTVYVYHPPFDGMLHYLWREQLYGVIFENML